MALRSWISSWTDTVSTGLEINSSTSLPEYFGQSRLSGMPITIDSIVYYFEEFHGKEFERIAPSSSSATTVFYFLLIKKITNLSSPLFNETNTDYESEDLESLKEDLGIYGIYLDNIIKMDINNRDHLTSLLETIARLFEMGKFKVDPEHQSIFDRIKNECRCLAKAVEHDITYTQACNSRLVYQLDNQKKHLQEKRFNQFREKHRQELTRGKNVPAFYGLKSLKKKGKSKLSNY